MILRAFGVPVLEDNRQSALKYIVPLPSNRLHAHPHHLGTACRSIDFELGRAMITPWRIQLLGGLSAERNGREIVRFQSRKTGSLLGFLALNLQQSHPRDNLVERIWPELAADNGRSCLSTSLHSLRLQLEPPDIPSGSVLLATRTEIRLNPEAVSTD